jgi:hypothetical protein
MNKLIFLFVGALLAASSVLAQDHSQHAEHSQHTNHTQHTTDKSTHNTQSKKTDHSRHPGHASEDPFVFYFNIEELQSTLTQDDAI